jgi:hypothetical protein
MIPAFLLKMVVGWLGPKFSKFAAPLIYAFYIIVAVGGFFGLKALYDSSVINKHEQKIERRAAPATNRAADQRANDTITNTKNEEEMHNVIAAQPDQPIAPTSHARACLQLRRAGRSSAACR